MNSKEISELRAELRRYEEALDFSASEEDEAYYKGRIAEIKQQLNSR